MALLPHCSNYCNSCGNYHRGRSPSLLEEFFSPFPNFFSSSSPDHLLNDVLHVAGNLQRQDNSVTSVTVDKEKFQANFDVQHFKPEEITVKVSADNAVTIEAKHQEKQDPHGQVARHFVRKYVLPKYCDTTRLESRLSNEGVLSITAPTIINRPEERIIPISRYAQQNHIKALGNHK